VVLPIHSTDQESTTTLSATRTVAPIPQAWRQKASTAALCKSTPAITPCARMLSPTIQRRIGMAIRVSSQAMKSSQAG
jgi:hypothetical protein